MDRIEAFYNQPYLEHWRNTAVFADYLEMEIRRIRQTIKGGSVLEIGSGTGRVLTVLSEIAESIVGVERSPRNYELSKARVKATNVEILLGDFLEVDFEEKRFDHILAVWNTFGNLYRTRDAALEKALNLLTSRGKVYLSVVSQDALDPFLEMIALNPVTVEKITDDYVFLKEGLISERFSEEKLKRIFERFGLCYRIQRLTPISYWCECWIDRTSPKGENLRGFLLSFEDINKIVIC